MSNHVFISYTRKDAEFAHHLAVDLEARGFDVWLDKALLGGEAWRKVIEHKVKTCREMVVVISPEGLKSRWVQHEGSMAYTLEKRILPVVCKPIQESLPVFAEDVQTLDFSAGYQDGLRELVRLLTPPNPFQDLLDYQVKIYKDHGELMSEAILGVILEHEAVLEIGEAARRLIEASRSEIETRKIYLRSLEREIEEAEKQKAALAKMLTEYRAGFDTTLRGLAAGFELRDMETESHIDRVIQLALSLGTALGLGEAELEDLKRGAILHDIGKMGVPESILHKPGPLSAEEWEVMKRHPFYGYALLSQIPILENAAEIIYCHHENWDGSGYPRGLKGEEIPAAARVFSIVDIWDGLTTDRPYRKRWEQDKALDFMRAEAGKRFDARIVAVFIEMVEAGAKDCGLAIGDL